jgi:hypothetical protein
MRPGARAAMALCAALPLVAGGCIVDSRCQADYDCSGAERCDRTTGQCALECSAATDCYVGGQYIGKECLDHRCQFRFDERVAAPNFCLEVVNPRSALYGQDLCLSEQKGKVVLLYFAWLT